MRVGRASKASAPGLTSLEAVAHEHHLGAQLLVSNYDNTNSDLSRAIADRLLENASYSGALASALARVVASERWDGLTVDLESLGVSDTIGLVRFLGNLRHDLVPSKGLSVDVSAATSLSAYAQMGYDLTAMSLDARIVLMAYDDHGPTWSGPEPVDRLAWQRASLSVLLSRVPSSRVVSGVAGYGYTWPAGARLHAGVRVADAQAFKMAIVAHVAARFDPVAGEYEATLLDGTVVWRSSDRSIRLRRALAIADRVPAIAVWELSSVDDLG